MPNWKSKKDGTHFRTDKVKRDNGNPDVHVEVDVNDLESFADEKKEGFDNEITASYDFGDFVKINSDNDNDNYDKYRNVILKVVNVAKNKNEHPGFDEGVGEALYDFKTIDGKDVPFSLYQYELESVSTPEVNNELDAIINKTGKYWVSPYDDPNERRVDIVRFKQNGSSRVIKRNVPESVAQLHCRDEKTHGDGWFDGYRARK